MALELVPVPVSGYSASTSTQTYTGTFGYQITPKADVTITAIGAFTSPGQTSWTNPVQFAIYRESDSVAVYSGSIPANRAGTTQIGAIVYLPVTPFVLPSSGGAYRIALYMTGPDSFALGMNNLSNDSTDFTYGTGVQNATATTISYPGSIQSNYPGTRYPYMGPGLQYTTSAVAATGASVTGPTTGAVGSGSSFTFSVNGNTARMSLSRR